MADGLDLLLLTGFEHGVYDTDDTWNAPTGSATREVTALASRTGDYGFRHSHAATRANSQLGTLATGIGGCVAYVKFAVLPNASVPVIFTGASSTGRFGIAWNNSTGRLRAFVGTDASEVTGTDAAIDIDTGTWYRLEFTWNNTNDTCDMQVDGEPGGQADHAGVAGVPANLTFMYTSTLYGTSTVDVYFDDVVMYNAAARYPLGEVSVISVRPTLNGTHVNPSNFTQEPGTSSPPSNPVDAVDDPGPFSADSAYVYKDTTGTSSDCLQYLFTDADFPSHSEIFGVAVNEYWSNSGSGDQIINAGSRLVDGADTDNISGSSLIVHSGGQWTGNPSTLRTTDPWDVAGIRGLKYEHGRSTTTITPQGRLHAVGLEVAYIPSPPPPEASGILYHPELTVEQRALYEEVLSS